MENKIEDTQYWKNRKPDDPRLDWRINEKNKTWIEEYSYSQWHPHRQLIIKELNNLWPFQGLLEVGCASAPNLMEIERYFHTTSLTGIDVNAHAIKEAEQNIPDGTFLEGDVRQIPFLDKSFDIVLADAILMYLNQLEIGKALDEMRRVARKGIIIIDWFDKDPNGVIKDFHWARNYDYLLTNMGFKMRPKYKLTQQDWPSDNWIRNGYMFIGMK